MFGLTAPDEEEGLLPEEGSLVWAESVWCEPKVNSSYGPKALKCVACILRHDAQSKPEFLCHTEIHRTGRSWGGDKGKKCSMNRASPKVRSPIEPKGFNKLLPKDRRQSLGCMDTQIEITPD